MKKYYPLLALALFASAALPACQDDKEEEELELAKKELSASMVGTWDWDNYNEHAVYTFRSDGTVAIAFDRNNGTVRTTEETWATIDGQSFYIQSASRKNEYKNVSVKAKTVGTITPVFIMTGEICDPTDCDTETWISK